MKVVATKSSKDNLCDWCKRNYPTCGRPDHISFGNGVGNDNLIECSNFENKKMFNFKIKVKEV